MLEDAIAEDRVIRFVILRDSISAASNQLIVNRVASCPFDFLLIGIYTRIHILGKKYPSKQAVAAA